MDLMPAASDNIIPLLIDDKADVLSAISEADCYLMHSNQEGFGLVILESMLNETPWISRQIAGAAMLNKFGKTYQTDGQLINLLKNFDASAYDISAAKQHVLDNHTIRSTVDDIEQVIKEKS